MPRRAGPAMRELLEVRLGEEAERLERSAEGRGAGGLARLLGDVYLHGVDEFLAHEGRVFRRAFDGLVVFCESRAQAERTLAELGEHLRASRGLELSAAETNIRRRRAGFSAR